MKVFNSSKIQSLRIVAVLSTVLSTMTSQQMLQIVPRVLLLVLMGSLLTACGVDHGNADHRVVAHSELTRKLPIDGTHNFRDLGGYQTTDGRRLKWGLIYRADKLSELSGQDQRYLQRIKLAQIVDFRAQYESDEEPDIVPESVVYKSIPIAVGGVDSNLLREKIESGDFGPEIADFLVDANQQFVTEFTPQYKNWIHSLLEPSNLPQVFHCTAGKDRTGFAAAILLLALGVDRQTVMDDYMKTNDYTRQITDRRVTLIKVVSLWSIDAELLRPLLGVDARFLQAAFEQMEQSFGSVDNYLTNGLGLTTGKRQQLREVFLQ